jgi:hypothetical protein
MVTGFVVRCRLTQTAPPHYAVRVPRCRVSPRASFRPRLTTTPLPPARGKHHLSPQGTFTPKQSPMPGIHRRLHRGDADGDLARAYGAIRRNPAISDNDFRAALEVFKLHKGYKGG